jgi:DNA-binding PadR family transcriptional regulator
MIENDATAVGWQPGRHSRFEVAAPRHFLLPALLLLLSEEPRHGYSLAKGLQELQAGRVDRGGVYRALAQLERDGLVGSSSGAPARQGRRVYCLTDAGKHELRRWMGVIKEERDGLDRVLRRYVATGTIDAVLAEVEGGWHAVTATPWSPVSSTSRVSGSRGPSLTAAFTAIAGGVNRTHDASVEREPGAEHGQGAADDSVEERFEARCFRVIPDRSVALIDARSSVGPITFGAIGLTGTIVASAAGRRVHPQPPPTAHLQMDVERLQSGNSLYDAELLRRIDARRHPTVSLELRACTPLGSTGRYRLAGDVTFHGESRPLDGTVSVVMPTDRTMVVRGEQVVDIRDFGVASPTVLMLRIYPDVLVKLQVEAELDEPEREE